VSDLVTEEFSHQLCELAAGVATEAGQRAMLGRDTSTVLTTKSSETDFVTNMDREIERYIVEMLSDARPLDGFLVEEGNGKASRSGVIWCIDPIDGTTNYIRNLPHYSVSIGALIDGRCVAAAVCDPSAGETFTADFSPFSARLGGELLHVSGVMALNHALVATGFGYREALRAQQAATIRRVLPQISDVRRPGSAAISLAWVAAGRLDAFWEIGLSPWDWVAGAHIAEQAGAVVQRWSIRDSSDELLVAGTPAIFEALDDLIRSSGPLVDEMIGLLVSDKVS